MMMINVGQFSVAGNWVCLSYLSGTDWKKVVFIAPSCK